jgi:hypothetical protein
MTNFLPTSVMIIITVTQNHGLICNNICDNYVFPSPFTQTLTQFLKTRQYCHNPEDHNLKL